MNTRRSREDVVYSNTVVYLLDLKADVICGCPPSGSDYRFPRCLLPKSEGGRDEVDITAMLPDGTLLLIECKGPLTDALSRRNRALESDSEKLARLLSYWSIEKLSETLTAVHGVTRQLSTVRGVLAVDEINCVIPPSLEASVWLVTNGAVSLPGELGAEARPVDQAGRDSQ